MVPHETVNFANFGFSQVAFPAFPHHFCGILFYSILGLYYYHRNLWVFFAAVNPMFKNREISLTTFTLWPL